MKEVIKDILKAIAIMIIFIILTFAFYGFGVLIQKF